jgi:sterol desaturase/sphingolipid hydroxylase (fatty acid hydroxylase superfamily)
MVENFLFAFIATSPLISWLAACAIGLGIERLRPVERRQPHRAIALNFGYAIVHSLGRYILAPVAAVASVAAVNALGAGWIVLPSNGWGLLWAIPLYLLAMDLAEYLFHRAQHASALLWAMHSLHHSEPALNATTTIRHFWAEAALKGLTVYPLVALALHPSAAVTAAYVLASYWNFVPHMNLRWSLGGCSWLINSPHYHRLHHAVDPAYRERNFAALFPIFDVVFGTYRRPARGEYPAVGLDTGEAPASLVEAALWPLRRYLRPHPAAGISR